MSLDVDEARRLVEVAEHGVSLLFELPLSYTERETLGAVRDTLAALDAVLSVLAEHEHPAPVDAPPPPPAVSVPDTQTAPAAETAPVPPGVQVA